MGNIFASIAARLTRRARPIKKIPVLRSGYWAWTPESCLLCSEAVTDVFRSFDVETQEAMTFPPKGPGSRLARARFWQERLRPALPPREYHAAMMRITGWCARCVRREVSA